MQQLTPATSLEWSRPSSPDAEPQPQPLPARALPMALWEDHLLPLLTCKDAARLACTCRALKGVVRELFKGDLGTVKMKKLRAVLTTFPVARSLLLEESHYGWWERPPEEGLVEWLREGGRGSHLVKVHAEDDRASDLVHTALRGGALPSLKAVNVKLEERMARASLTEGFLGSMHELCMDLTRIEELQLAALGLVRQLPALIKLDLKVSSYMAMRNDPPVHWPPFIPPSLKALFLDVKRNTFPNQLLLPALPGMLEASGARLERLEVLVPNGVDNLGDGLVHVAQAVRCCSSTLKAFLFTTTAGDLSIGWEAESYDCYAGEKAQLRVDWGEVLVGVSASAGSRCSCFRTSSSSPCSRGELPSAASFSSSCGTTSASFRPMPA
jgi:hypothetical protein